MITPETGLVSTVRDTEIEYKEMQSSLPAAPTTPKKDSSIKESVALPLYEVGTPSQALDSSTRADDGKPTASERANGQHLDTGVGVFRPASDGFCQGFCDALTPRGRHKKAWENLILVLGIVVTLSSCSVPTILFFALSVSGYKVIHVLHESDRIAKCQYLTLKIK